MDRPTRRRVLIVDDNPTFARVLREALSTRGYVCETARSAAEAWNMFGAGEFDAIVSDLHIADRAGEDRTSRDRSGIALLRRIRDESPGCARVLVSGSLDPDEVAPLGDSVIDAYLRKPFELSALIETIESSLARKRSSRASGH
ncbi:MAG: response regulator [Polyangiaceae bacterium]|nr:response regulator [Polyangiaceae bacterium]